MNKKNQNQPQTALSEDTPRALLFASTEEELQILCKTIPLEEGKYDAFHNIDEAKKALQHKNYTAIITDETNPNKDIQELKDFANLHAEKVRMVCSSQQATAPVNAVMLTMSPKNIFVHKSIESDLLTPCLSAMFESSRRLGWIHDVHSKFWKMRERLKSSTKKVILLVGDSGTSKYSLAQITHSRSEYRNKPFIFANCKCDGEKDGTWDLDAKKRFRNSLQQLINETRGGTLYFHEVDRLDYEALEILEQVIKTASITTDSGKEIPFTGRIICSTRKELQLEVEGDRCPREFAKLMQENVIRIPALSEYNEELAEMAQMLLHNYCYLVNGKEKEFSVSAIEVIEKHIYSRNMRELFDMIKEAYSLTKGRKINSDAVHLTLQVENEDTDRERRRKVKQALRKNKGNKQKTSVDLGISRKCLYNWMKELKIELDYR